MKLTQVAAALILSISAAAPASARYDQFGFPAKCTVYDVCDEQACVRPTLPVIAVLLFEKGGSYFMKNGFAESHVKIGYFHDLEQARRFVAATESGDSEP